MSSVDCCRIRREGKEGLIAESDGQQGADVAGFINLTKMLAWGVSFQQGRVFGTVAGWWSFKVS